MPITRQCQLLGVARSTLYYQPQPVSPQDLAIMGRLDELHLEHPFLGARKLVRLLKDEGFDVGRRHMTTLMRRMGIEALYRKPRLSQPGAGHKIYPYLLSAVSIERPNQVWAAGGDSHPLKDRAFARRHPNDSAERPPTNGVRREPNSKRSDAVGRSAPADGSASQIAAVRSGEPKDERRVPAQPSIRYRISASHQATKLCKGSHALALPPLRPPPFPAPAQYQQGPRATSLDHQLPERPSRTPPQLRHQ
jgi:hypothetical protein